MIDYVLRWTDEPVNMKLRDRMKSTQSGDFEPEDWRLIQSLADKLARQVPMSQRLSVRKVRGEPWDITVTMSPACLLRAFSTGRMDTLPDAIVSVEKYFLLTR